MAISRRALVSVAVATALVGLTSWALLSTLLATSSEPPTFYGARLGLTASELRARFAPPVPGAFRIAADAPRSGDLALEWRPLRPSASSPGTARFELHAGLLVAIRGTVGPNSSIADGPPLSESPVSLISRRRNLDRTVTFAILARDCPTHADEIRALLRERAP